MGDVHLWWAPLDHSASLVKKMEACLAAEEKERAQRLVRWQDRKRWIVSRGLLRHLLSAVTGEEAEKLCFQYGLHGKPVLRGYDCPFNLSHSHDWVVIAVSPSSPVGVDVERVCPDLEADKLIDLVMSPSEKTEWKKLPAEGRLVAFFRLWTRKEAVVKAAGEGLSRSLPGFSVGWQPDRYGHVDEKGVEWEVVSLDWIPGYEMACCIGSRSAVADWRRRTLQG